MEIYNLFRDQIEESSRLAELESEIEAAHQSLSRRDQRIAELKQALSEARTEDDLAKEDYRGIIAGLEQALLLQGCHEEGDNAARIAELESQLNAMTEYADKLHERCAAAQERAAMAQGRATGMSECAVAA